MTKITYECWLCDQFGNHVVPVPDIRALAWGWAANAVGACTAVLPIGYARYLRNTDTVLEINRRIEGVADAPPRVFLIEDSDREQDGKRRTLTLHGVDLMAILARHIIDYAAGSSGASKTDYPSDIIRALVIENIGSSATNTDRRLDSSIFSVQAAQSFGTSMTKKASRRNLLTTCQEVARTSYENGTAVYFDMALTGFNPITFQFRVFSGIRGIDHSATSASPITLSIEDGHLRDVKIQYIASNAANIARVNGAGREDVRLTELVEAANSAWRAGPFARKEINYGDSGLTTSASLISAGDDVLIARKPRRRLSATIMQSDTLVIGREFGLGDKIGVGAPGLGDEERFDAYINSGQFAYTRAGEKARVRIYSEAVI